MDVSLSEEDGKLAAVVLSDDERAFDSEMADLDVDKELEEDEAAANALLIEQQRGKQEADGMSDEEEFVDYEGVVDDLEGENPDVEEKDDDVSDGGKKQVTSRGYAAVNTASFRDMFIKVQILRALQDCGFEHPSEVQQECIPQAILGLDVVCQAKSGMGKTAVFVIAVLQQIEVDEEAVNTLVLCHARELAYQICQEFERFGKFMPDCKVAVLYGGFPLKDHIKMLRDETPHVVVGTPGRVLHLVRDGHLNLGKVERFILDECDHMLGALQMRRDVQEIFKHTPREKQVMLFSATISKEMKTVCQMFTKNAIEIYIDKERLTLFGLQQHYAEIKEKEKTKKLSELLDNLEFNQVVIFVNTIRGAIKLQKLLLKSAFPTAIIHSKMEMNERLETYKKFKAYESRILVATNLFGRGVDIEGVNIVINYDMPDALEPYLHRVGRAGRFGTKGLAITFVSSSEDKEMLDVIQTHFNVKITPLPDKIEPSAYMTS